MATSKLDRSDFYAQQKSYSGPGKRPSSFRVSHFSTYRGTANQDSNWLVEDIHTTPYHYKAHRIGVGTTDDGKSEREKHTHSDGHKELYQRLNFSHSGSSSPLAFAQAWNSRYRAQQCLVWFEVGKRLSRGAVLTWIVTSVMARWTVVGTMSTVERWGNAGSPDSRAARANMRSLLREHAINGMLFLEIDGLEKYL